MRFAIDYEYNVTFVPRGHRNTRKETSCATHEVEIREVAPGAPRLLHQAGSKRVYAHCHPAFPTFEEDGAPRGARIVEFEGRLYAEACGADELEALVKVRGDEGRSPFHVRPRGVYMNGGDLMGEEDSRPLIRKKPTHEALARKHGGFRDGTYADDGGRHVAGLLDQRAAELIVCEGRVYAPASEPVIFIDATHEDGENVVFVGVEELRQGGWSAFEKPDVPPPQTSDVRIFRLDEKEDAIAYARLAAGDDCRLDDQALVEHVTADALRLDGGVRLLRAAHQAAAEFGGTVLGMAPSVAAAWAGLRDAARATGGLSGRLVLDRLEDYLASVARDGHPSSPSAAALARTILAGGFDLGLAVEVGARDIGLGLAALAMPALRRGEAHGTSWLRKAAPLEDPSEDEGYLAQEVASLFEMDRICERLGRPERWAPPAEGDVVVAVASRDGPDYLSRALVQFDAALEPVRCLGLGGLAPSPRIMALARSHAALALDARPELEAGPYDRLDDEALAF